MISAWLPRAQGVLAAFRDPSRLEAPDRAFIGHRDIVTRAMARYQYVSQFLHGDLLDIGCGRGYGFDIVGPVTTKHTGIDLTQAFLRDAAREYCSVPFVNASGEAIPVRDASYDSVIAFEVIEHLEDDQSFLTDLKRILRPGGTLAISTPNRLVASGSALTPLNKFHVREYTAEEFSALLETVFPSVAVVGAHEGRQQGEGRNSLVDRIPIDVKYLLPPTVQDVLSVAIRPPLQISDCQFTADELNTAHTLVAICQL